MAARGCQRRVARLPDRALASSAPMGKSRRHSTRCHQHHRGPLALRDGALATEAEAYYTVAGDRSEVGASPTYDP
jgi:hypothetical protein